MKKIAKALAISGVVAGLGVAALPLSSYALDPVPSNSTASTTITAHVIDAIAIKATAAITFGDGSSELVPGTADTKTVNVEVATNNPNGFKVTATGTDLTGSTGTIASNESAGAGVEGWSFKGGDINSAIALNATPQLIWTYTGDGTSAIDEDEDFTVTVGTAATTKTGTYVGTITFTAAPVVE